jgi:hypothetical protein
MAARIWTLEQRQGQAEAIRHWKPWKQSTGPKSSQGKTTVYRNAYSGGQWSDLKEVIKALNQSLRKQKN